MMSAAQGWKGRETKRTLGGKGIRGKGRSGRERGRGMEKCEEGSGGGDSEGDD